MRDQQQRPIGLRVEDGGLGLAPAEAQQCRHELVFAVGVLEPGQDGSHVP
jgi:hypothetical protein